MDREGLSVETGRCDYCGAAISDEPRVDWCGLFSVSFHPACALEVAARLTSAALNLEQQFGLRVALVPDVRENADRDDGYPF